MESRQEGVREQNCQEPVRGTTIAGKCWDHQGTPQGGGRAKVVNLVPLISLGL